MRERSASRVAWATWLIIVVFVAASLVLTVLNWRHILRSDLPIFLGMPVAALGYGTIGALITARRRNRIGWLFLVIATGFALFPLSYGYVLRGLISAPGSLPGTSFAAWVRSWVVTLAIAPIPLVLLLFPSGRLPSRRWRIGAGILVALPTLNLIATAFRPGTIFEMDGIRIENPFGLVGSTDQGPWVVFVVFGLLWAGAAASTIVSLVRRYRRATGEERLQLKWLAYVAGTAGALFLPGMVLSAAGLERPTGLVLVALAPVAFLVGIPAASAIAILKHGLYDVDVVIKKTVAFGILAALVSVLYVGIVVAIGSAVTGSDTDARTLITFMAAAILALLFEPVRRRANHLANRVIYGNRATPYEVLSEFSDRMAGSYSTDDILPRMAQILGTATGAVRAEVWLRVESELRSAAQWPDAPAATHQAVPIHGEELPTLPGDAHAFPVQHQGQLLGALTVAMPPSEPLTPAGAKLVRDVAAQAGLVLRNVRLIEELRASRQRIVTAQDARAKALERNIHDGAQQQLVALMVKLRLVEAFVAKDPQRASSMLSDLQADAKEALEGLRDLARGIYPPLLADKGLVEALSAQARKAVLPVEVDGDGIARYAPELEAAIYFCCLEALQNATKYSRASHVAVRLRVDHGTVGFTVTDDGAGFDPDQTPKGAGLQNMLDRLESLGGTLDVWSRPGEGTSVSGRIPAPLPGA